MSRQYWTLHLKEIAAEDAGDIRARIGRQRRKAHLKDLRAPHNQHKVRIASGVLGVIGIDLDLTVLAIFNGEIGDFDSAANAGRLTASDHIEGLAS